MQTSLFSNNIRVRHVSDGTTDTFSCTIELIDESYLQVYFGETLQPTGWTYDESFQQVVFDEIPAEGTIITFLRYFPTIYTKSITEKGIINPEVLDNQMVEMVARIQTVEEKLSRTPIYPIDTEKSSEEVYDDFKRIENVATSAATKVLDTLEEIEGVRNEAVLGMGAAADAAKLNVSKYTSQMIDVIKDEGQESIDIARTWATGEQAEVEAIEAGQLSSRGFADLSLAFANAPEDVPVDESGMIAMEVFRGPKGDKGEDGRDGIDGKDGTDGKDGRDGTGLEIGDIGFVPLGIDETKNLRRYLNGQVISQSQFESFTKKIKEAIAINPNLATSETNWQAEVTNSVNGTCGKFVIDDEAGTIRLPKYPEYVSKEYVEAAVVGNGYGMGVTDGSNDLNFSGNSTVHTYYASYRNDVVGAANGGSVNANAKIVGLSQDATKSGIVADLTQATTETIPCKWFIQVASGSEESVDVTREIELNNPFSLLDYKWSEYELSNASWLLSNGQFNSGATYISVYNLLLEIYNGTVAKDGVSVKMSTEAYTDTDFVINTADTTFRLPVKVKLASGNAVVGNGMTLGLTDGTNYGGIHLISTSDNNSANLNGMYNVNVGTISNAVPPFTRNATLGITTDPTKSGIETSSQGLKLYFYVGETIQDANVIAASQVLTDVANLKSYAIGVPDLTAGIDITSMETYTFPVDGMLFMYSTGGFIAFGSNKFDSGFQGYTYGCFGNTNTATSTECIVVKGETITRKTASGSYKILFFPLKGVN